MTSLQKGLPFVHTTHLLDVVYLVVKVANLFVIKCSRVRFPADSNAYPLAEKLSLLSLVYASWKQHELPRDILKVYLSRASALYFSSQHKQPLRKLSICVPVNIAML